MNSELPEIFRFPAEWEPQSTVWFAWPTREDLWPGVLSKVRSRLAELYVLVSQYEPVSLLCPESIQHEVSELMAQFGDFSEVTFFDYETDDVWIRDFGPLFVVNDSTSMGNLAISDWTYNAWGNKFPLQSRDNHVSSWIAKKIETSCFSVDAVIEGGGIESNGARQILTTEAVLLNKNRNGFIDHRSAERLLAKNLNVKEVLWLGDGLIGDDTDGHIDNLARFFHRDGILIATVGEEDANFTTLAKNLERAEAFRTVDGQPFEIVELPLPDPIFFKGERLAASYLNFLIVNGAVIVPTYRQPENDQRAITIIKGCFPKREVVGFDCCEILQEGGAIHCMSQHQPIK